MKYGYARVSTMTQKLKRQIDNIKAQHPDALIVTDEYTGTTMDRPHFSKLIRLLKPGDTVIFDEVSRMSRNAEEGFKLYRELYEKGVNLIFLKESHINTEEYKKALAMAELNRTGNEVADIALEAAEKILKVIQRQQIELAFKQAQKEVDLLHDRTSEGVKKAMERFDQEEIEGRPHTAGRPGGQKGAKLKTKKSIAAKEIIRKYNRDFGGPLNDVETMIRAGMLKTDYDKKPVIDKNTGEVIRMKTIKDYNRSTYYKYKRELMAELKESGE